MEAEKKLLMLLKIL